MLLTDFYRLDSLTQIDAQKHVAKIRLNKDNDIFKGHFPDNPVTPGVCMMQIIKEIVEQIVEQTLFMEQSSNVKFMAIINPEINPELILDIDIKGDADIGYQVKNTSRFGETVALKLSLNFKCI
ncbi:hypothetical protein [Sphingobacterium sp. SYP-B4668]|uniref:hypothetical protein n=1 Tax=Sphingobacterium sp. SYP-B4668 TaxID=2996035 RepID=UPI0022DDF682|nr:hypothetical protein [Sphingobacterium sp. SYP-B4668]